jgi:metal-responsive CopG/Arc/MetJ family transcriptional regulator
MALKNRTKITTTLDNKLIDKLDKLSKDTRIPKSRLFDEAVGLLLEKHND